MALPDSISASVQDYAKAVYALEAREGAAVSTNDLAERLGVTPGSVSGMVRKLTEAGLVEHEPYHGVRLTSQGRRVALEVLRHHRLLELFLAQELGMPWDRVHAEAEVLEHVLSEELERADRRAPGRPDRRSARRSDPHASSSRSRSARPTAWTSCRSVPPGASCACRTPTRRCCATWPSRASRSAIASRSSIASRSVGRCSCASASASIRSAARWPARCASRPRRPER